MRDRYISASAWPRVARISRRWREARALKSMRRSGHHKLKAVASSIDGALPMSEEERGWVRKIETLRSEMEASAEQISRVDHGAGTREAGSPGGSDAGRMVELETIGSVARISSKPLAWDLFLFRLVRILRPDTCIELGAAVGLSAAYQSAALACNDRGRLVTLEGSSTLAGLARDHLSRLGLDRATVEQGRFQDILRPVLSRLGDVDFAFIDGHHDYAATVGYFGLIREHMTDGVIVLDDIDWSSGMRQAWEVVCSDRRVSYAVDVASDSGSMGAVVVEDGVTGGERFRVRLSIKDPFI